MDYLISPLIAERWPALEDLFGRAGASNGCWCMYWRMYWRIGPRYHDRPRADNKRDLRRLAASGRPPGLLAFDGELAVGWCELAPRAELRAPGRYRASAWVRSRLTWGPGSGIPLTFPSHAWLTGGPDAAHSGQRSTLRNMDRHERREKRSGPAAQAAEWDARYTERDGARWSGRPNGRLRAEVASLTPGRALDVGCGEGADAIWLARSSWTVTAIDISDVAVIRAREAAELAGAGRPPAVIPPP